jgi:hypothetical protein
MDAKVKRIFEMQNFFSIPNSYFFSIFAPLKNINTSSHLHSITSAHQNDATPV